MSIQQNYSGETDKRQQVTGEFFVMFYFYEYVTAREKIPVHYVTVSQGVYVCIFHIHSGMLSEETDQMKCHDLFL